MQTCPAGADVFKGNIGVVGDDLCLTCAFGKHLENVAHPDARSGNRRATAANGVVNGDTGIACERHVVRLCPKLASDKPHSHSIVPGGLLV
jgi:hypothetical protein